MSLLVTDLCSGVCRAVTSAPDLCCCAGEDEWCCGCCCAGEPGFWGMGGNSSSAVKSGSLNFSVVKTGPVTAPVPTTMPPGPPPLIAAAAVIVGGATVVVDGDAANAAAAAAAAALVEVVAATTAAAVDSIETALLLLLLRRLLSVLFLILVLVASTSCLGLFRAALSVRLALLVLMLSLELFLCWCSEGCWRSCCCLMVSLLLVLPRRLFSFPPAGLDFFHRLLLLVLVSRDFKSAVTSLASILPGGDGPLILLGGETGFWILMVECESDGAAIPVPKTDSPSIALVDLCRSAFADCAWSFGAGGGAVAGGGGSSITGGACDWFCDIPMDFKVLLGSSSEGVVTEDDRVREPRPEDRGACSDEKAACERSS